MLRHAVALAALALVTGSCFQIDPLPDCADPSGMYARHHVCMPLAGPPLPLSAPPRQMILGDFDDEGVANDLAVLVDDLRVHVFAGLDLGDPAAPAEIAFSGGRVQAITAARFYQMGMYGEDILAVLTPAMATLPGHIAAARNGGDMFTSGVTEDVALRAAVDGAMMPTERACERPNSLAALYAPSLAVAAGVVVGCRSAPTADVPPEGPLDGLLVLNLVQSLLLAPRAGIASPYADVHGVAIAPLDGFGSDDLVYVHRRPGREHDELAVFLIGENFTFGGYVDIALAHGEVRGVIVADVDDDADTDLVAIHPDGRGVSVIRQRRADPLELEAPVFFEVGYEVRDAAVGDFTGDDATDIAVAHGVDDAGVDGISVLVRLPDLLPGTTGFALAPATFLPGTIVDLEPLDFDDDGRTDLAASVQQGGAGAVHVFVNRSPAGK